MTDCKVPSASSTRSSDGATSPARIAAAFDTPAVSSTTTATASRVSETLASPWSSATKASSAMSSVESTLDRASSPSARLRSTLLPSCPIDCHATSEPTPAVATPITATAIMSEPAVRRLIRRSRRVSIM
ncbi:MAG: hypothetical protein EA389_14715 [Ilumatobacter sp.]|nr:MAG: hypothetical protein EA389_14715 [Ilumatobacter sp.]